MTRSIWFLIICVTVFIDPEYAHGQSPNQLARGAQLWNLSCNQCHNRRSPLERTDAQWDVIASHMRTRANLTRSEVQALVAFLQEANGKQASDPETSAGRREADSTATGLNWGADQATRATWPILQSARASGTPLWVGIPVPNEAPEASPDDWRARSSNEE